MGRTINFEIVRLIAWYFKVIICFISHIYRNLKKKKKKPNKLGLVSYD